MTLFGVVERGMRVIEALEGSSTQGRFICKNSPTGFS
jgi:hypothetical protein